MKKIVGLFSMICTLVFAGQVEINIESAVKKAVNVDIKVVSIQKLESMNSILLVRFKGADGVENPLFASTDGKTVLGFSPFYFSEKENEISLVKSMVEEITLSNKNREIIGADKLFQNISSDRFLLIKSPNPKVTKTTIIVSDPDCPYCRQELQKIEERLKITHVKLIFAPVHDDRAFVKSELILKEASKAKTSEDKIKIIRKYFADIQLTPEQMKTNISNTKDNAQKLFGSGVVKGVPFIYEVPDSK